MTSSRPHRDRGDFRIIFSATLLAVVLVTFVAQTMLLLARGDNTSVTVNLVLQIVLLAAFWYWSAALSGSVVSAPFVLLVAIFFWHSTFLAGRYLHLSDVFQYSGEILDYGQRFVPAAVGLVSLCIAMTVIGSMAAIWQRALQTEPPDSRMRQPSESVTRYALFLFVAYILLTVIYAVKEGAASHQDYLDIYALASGSFIYRIYHMTKFLGVAIIALVFATARTRTSIWIAYSGTVFLIFVGALSGARSMPFLYCATLLISIDCFRRRIPLVAIVGVVFAAAAASWIITEARANGVGLQMLTSVHSGQPMSLWQMFWNSGGTITTVLRTMAFAAVHPPSHSHTLLDASVYVLPGPVVKLIAPAWTIEPPSDWLLKQSSDVASGEGLGYSLVAEAFLNYGLWGCLLFGVIGWLVAYEYFGFRFRRDLFSALQSINLVVLLALHLRNDAVTYVRVLIWGALLIAVARLIQRRSSVRRSIPVAPAIGEPAPRTVS